MLYIDRFAISTIPPRFGDDAIANSANRCPSLGGKIDPGMG
jgi:hypothetical protein